MSTNVFRTPITRLTCDSAGCPAFFDHETYEPVSVRYRAEQAGWQVRPSMGKGSRTAPDWCPEHRRD